MNILHLYPENDPLIAKHVAMLKNEDQQVGPDIVHVHGCWQYKIVRQALEAHRRGARIVFTPHGGLEPWIIAERRLSEKLYKTLLWQRQLVRSSYAVIVQGKMEAEALKELGWNPRIEMIRNAVITNSITPEAMNNNMEAVYRKVMDSNTSELMTDDTRLMMTLLLKAGITGDARWVTTKVPTIEEEDWRHLLLYADHENIRTTVDAGARILGVKHPYIETALIKSYLPTNYKKPKVTALDVTGIVNEMKRGPLTMRHFVELDHALRRDDVDDEWLVDALDEAHLLKYFRRLLQIQTEVTGLDEGFLPAPPLNDNNTQRIRKLLNNHLRI